MRLGFELGKGNEEIDIRNLILRGFGYEVPRLRDLFPRHLLQSLNHFPEGGGPSTVKRSQDRVSERPSRSVESATLPHSSLRQVDKQPTCSDFVCDSASHGATSL